LLPKLASATHTVSREAGNVQLSGPELDLFSNLFFTIFSDLGDSVHSAAEGAQLLEATGAALSLLPVMHQAWQQQQAARHIGPEQHKQLAKDCLMLWMVFPRLVRAFYDHTATCAPLPGSPKQHAAVARAALHLT
jgi:hypothetical protein